MGPQILPVDLVWVFLLLHRAALILIIIPTLPLLADQHLAEVGRLVERLAVNGLMRLNYGRQINQS